MVRRPSGGDAGAGFAQRGPGFCSGEASRFSRESLSARLCGVDEGRNSLRACVRLGAGKPEGGGDAVWGKVPRDLPWAYSRHGPGGGGGGSCFGGGPDDAAGGGTSGPERTLPMWQRQEIQALLRGEKQERLHFSTDVAGTTAAELRQNLEAHLTRARLDKTMPHEVARLDPLRVPGVGPTLSGSSPGVFALRGIGDRVREARLVRRIGREWRGIFSCSHSRASALAWSGCSVSIRGPIPFWANLRRSCA